MPFPTDYPKDAVATLVSPAGKPHGQLALAAYEVVGFALGQYFGNVTYPVGLDFSSLSKIGEGADLVNKLQARALQLKASGAGVFTIILQLVAEFGPQVWTLINEIKAALNGTTTPAAS